MALYQWPLRWLTLAAAVLWVGAVVAAIVAAPRDRPGPASEVVRLHPLPPAPLAAPWEVIAAPALPALAPAPPARALATLASLAEAAREQRWRVLETGTASWYGPGFAGRPTANGEVFDPKAMTAAHPVLPLGSEVMVVNLANGRSARLRINDRGPFIEARVIDVSEAAARRLGFHHDGLAEVRIERVPAGRAYRPVDGRTAPAA